MTALGLGTAQLGAAYGVSNRGGRPSEAEAAAILECALERDVDTIDTAPAYGDAEALLGRLLPAGAAVRIVTKTEPLTGTEVNAADRGAVRRSAERSLERLRRDRLDGLLVHHGSQLALPGGEQLAEELIGLRDAGVATRIGVSVYDREEIEIARRLLPLDLVQFPLNVLDQRLLRDGTLAELREEGVELHARSAFLQGLLLMDPAELPAHLAGGAEPLRRYHQARRKAGLAPIEAALGFLRASGAVDVALVGTNSVSELEECAEAMRAAPAALDFAPLAIDDPNLIDPRKWPAP
ncbi:MAG TPA: aldo/keto reductase [Solirubrobacterales bacterium]|nr:aldo/keto reductase [Solirubrobacterales bacterium]